MFIKVKTTTNVKKLPFLVWIFFTTFSFMSTNTSRQRKRGVNDGTATAAATMTMVAAALSSSSGATNSNKIKVAVMGGTGRLGQATITELRNHQIPIKCLVRPSSKIPKEWKTSNDIEILRGELLESIGNDEPSQAMKDLLKDCTHCLALYGATRKTKLSDFWIPKNRPQIEDTDPTHAKQINYSSIKAIIKASQQPNCKCKYIFRVTGKGEDPTSFFSILINGLGSFAKGWNYEGEQVLRTTSTSNDNNDNINYTILRPGIMKEDFDITPGPDKNGEYTYLKLANNGRDLPVSAVSYKQMGRLIVQCILHGESSHNVTITAMNVKTKDPSEIMTVQEQIKALKPDTREFPKTLIKEHKQAVYNAARRILGVTMICVAVLVKWIFL